MEVVLAILAVCFMGLCIYNSVAIRLRKEKAEYEATALQYKESFNQQMEEYKSLYGNPAICLEVFDMSASVLSDEFWQRYRNRANIISSYIIVFDANKKILIKGQLYDYSDISGYKIESNNRIISATSRTSAGDVAGRAFVGGVLAGGIGALAGAGSAKRELTVSSQKEVLITIFTNSIASPSIQIKLLEPEDQLIAKIDGVFRIVCQQE